MVTWHEHVVSSRRLIDMAEPTIWCFKCQRMVETSVSKLGFKWRQCVPCGAIILR